MSRGNTWGDEETRYFIEIWADDKIKSELEKTHKNADTFALFSERMKQAGYNRTADQCQLKHKKLRQGYTKTRDAVRTSGASPDEIDKCPFYDLLDVILGTRPTSSPVRVIESSPAPSTSSTETAIGSSAMEDAESASPGSESTSTDDSSSKARRGRKRKAKTEDLIEVQRQLLNQFTEAEESRQEKEEASMDRWMRRQEEIEAQRPRQMQEQQASMGTMFMNIMQTLVQCLQNQQHQPAASWGQAPSLQPPVNWQQPHSSTYPPHPHVTYTPNLQPTTSVPYTAPHQPPSDADQQPHHPSTLPPQQPPAQSSSLRSLLDDENDNETTFYNFT